MAPKRASFCGFYGVSDGKHRRGRIIRSFLLIRERCRIIPVNRARGLPFLSIHGQRLESTILKERNKMKINENGISRQSLEAVISKEEKVASFGR